ncbi:hypothetical protein XENTR_v10020786 [Xenopus tropicalis]|nr:hypothetical protein XENTR_v10020786 [Xenopus tropicalis]KAE8584012.1 hypothetical protein XENTR_v10020786 [Xenopus tropicalis]
MEEEEKGGGRLLKRGCLRGAASRLHSLSRITRFCACCSCWRVQWLLFIYTPSIIQQYLADGSSKAVSERTTKPAL